MLLTKNLSIMATRRWTRRTGGIQRDSPEKQSMREAMVHLLARYREMRPLFLAAARPMKVEWKMRPYLGVFPRVLRALGGGRVGGGARHRLTIKAHGFDGMYPN